MKKLFILLSLACMGLAVSSCYDDSELWESVNGLESRVKTLETLCSEMNTNISSLQDLATAVQKGGYITEVTPLTENGVEVGYKVTLNDGRMVTIYHGKNGSAGNAPQIGVKQDSDGKYYWVVGGEWIKDDKGNKVPVSSGTTPKIKVENGKWYVSYDGGTTWEELGAATASDTCLFDDVTYTNGVLTLKFADGNVLSFPIGDTFRIVLGDFDPNWGSKLEIPYTIQGASGEVMIFAMTDFGEEVWVEILEESAYSGKIKVNIGLWDEEYTVKLAIFAVDETGKTISKIIKLSTGVMYTEDTEYFVGYEESQLLISLTTNRSYEVSTNADWITYVETKAVEEKTLAFNIQENTGYYRNAEIYITSNNKKITIPVCQKPGDGSVFYVTKKAHVYEHRDLDVYLAGDYSDILVNKAGEKLHEVLGYDTWEDLATAIGPWETVEALAGDVIIRAYDPSTGQPYGDTDYYYYYYGNVPSFRFDADGKINRYNYCVEFVWYFNNTEESGEWKEVLNPYFACSVNKQNIKSGASYTFGILLSSDDAEARIEVTIEVEDFVDPEEGQYTDPADPGRYEFDINDTIKIQSPEFDIWSKIYTYHPEVYESIKETLGMTSFELFEHRNDINSYMISGEEIYDGSSWNIDVNGNINGDYNSLVVSLYWNMFSPNPSNNSVYINIPIDWNTYYWSDSVVEAAEAGSVISYKYVIEYGSYELVFNHNVKFVKTIYEDPEAGMYDDPLLPGKYEFDIINELVVSPEDADKDYNLFTFKNTEVWEIIKKTLGMTTSEIYQNADKVSSYCILDGDKVDNTYCYFDEDGNYLTTYDYQRVAVIASWNLNSYNSVNNYLSISPSSKYDSETQLYRWMESALNAAEKGTVIKYQYVYEYEDYQLVFNHEIKLVRGDTQVQ